MTLTREKDSAIKIPRRFYKGSLATLREYFQEVYEIDATTNPDEYDPYKLEIPFGKICAALDKDPDDYQEHMYVNNLIKSMRDFVIEEVEGWRQIASLKGHEITPDEYDKFIKHFNIKYGLFNEHGEVHFESWIDRTSKYRQLDYPAFEILVNERIQRYGGTLLLYIERAEDYGMEVRYTGVPQLDIAIYAIQQGLNFKEMEELYKQKRKELEDKYQEYYSDLSKEETEDA